MKKGIILSLLIVSPVFVHAMDSESSFLSFFSSWLSSNQPPIESKLITDLRKSKNDFGNQLIDKHIKDQLQHEMTIQTFSIRSIDTNPAQFLQYCYYLKFSKNILNINLEDLTIPLLEKCHTVRRDGYSALGAAIISENTSIEEKRNFIETLTVYYAFKPTLKDIALEALHLYDNIATEHKKIFLHLLHPHFKINWSVLPHEIRLQIADYLVKLFKKDFWLLSEGY